MNYYIADLHLGHANVIGFDGRPFADVTETLIHRWNSTVNRADTVYVLDDFIRGRSHCGLNGWRG